MAIARTVGADVTIGEMYDADWDAVRDIYAEGIATGNASIETEPPTWEVWNGRHLKHCRLVARRGDIVVGWAALGPFSVRSAYSGVAEVSIYIAERARGQGIGRALLQAIIAESERHGIWTIQAGIFPENTISIALHTRCGFREIGTRKQLGKLNGVWRDVVLFERRSTIVGVD
ncbi:MAG: N-acetyltransferase family protein [Candidatus Hydrogenedentes bacterium]|nr:N-acetyltransferase family protein [Candidatus Hydrogenedentota bacterium]